MKRNFHGLLVLFILLIVSKPQAAYSQIVFEGQVIDKITELPLPAVTITLSKRNINTITNDQGYFNMSVDRVSADDILIFTSVGYQTYQLQIKNYKQYPYIKMQPTNTTLNQVNIRAGKQTRVRLDKFLLLNTNLYKTNPNGIMTVTNRWTAKLFYSPKANAQLISVQLGRQDYGNYLITTNKFARFNLHIMDIDAVTGLPSKILFSKEINLSDNSHLVSIDLRNYNVILPSSKFFVVIEHLFIPYNEVVSIVPEQKVAGTNKKGKQILEDTPLYIICYQPFLATYRQDHPVTFWFKDKSDSWTSQTVVKYDTACISATILY